MENWKFAVKDIDDFKRRGLCAWYAILSDGVHDSYTGETAESYAAKGYTVLTTAEFDALVEQHENELIGHWCEISEDFYEQQMNVLPPLRWHNGGFYISEADTGNIHGFYQELNGKFYTSLQRTSTKRDDIISDLRRAVAAGEVEDRTSDNA